MKDKGIPVHFAVRASQVAFYNLHTLSLLGQAFSAASIDQHYLTHYVPVSLRGQCFREHLYAIFSEDYPTSGGKVFELQKLLVPDHVRYETVILDAIHDLLVHLVSDDNLWLRKYGDETRAILRKASAEQQSFTEDADWSMVMNKITLALTGWSGLDPRLEEGCQV